MKYLPLIWSGLVRKPVRSALTLLSVLVAFLLFGLLQGINAGYGAIVEYSRLDRLLTDTRVPGGHPLPVSALAKIRALPGVTRVCGRAAFVGYYQDPKNRLFALATAPEDWLAVRPEYVMAPQHLAALEGNRAGIAMSPALRARLGLELGDKVPIHSPIPRKDGNPVWTFELVASFDNLDRPGEDLMAMVNYDYFNEARLRYTDTVDRIIVRIADPDSSAQMAAAIDALFANSAAETRTQSERAETESAIQQLGDIEFFTNAICGAVFFALLFVTGNTMVQSFRERIPELAVLKTLGFPDAGVLALVLAEAALLCSAAAAVGLAIAAALFPSLKEIIGLQRLALHVVAWGIAAALLLALVSAALPALRAKRLRIVEALRR